MASSSNSSSKISSTEMERVLESLMANQTRESTKANYQSIWRQFNRFLVRLDWLPRGWEERASLFSAHLVSKGIQSSTLKSYISAIKHMVNTYADNYEWNDKKILLSAIVRACSLKNNCLTARLPIQLALFEMLLFEIERNYQCQPYLCSMYKAIFALAYYGMLRIGEITLSKHVIRAKDVHIGSN